MPFTEPFNGGTIISIRARFTVVSVAEGRAALDHFNGFHDGFIRRIEILSRDRFEDIGNQTVTGTYDITIEFAHYNYPDGKLPLHPADQIVEARFEDAEDILVDLAREYLGSSISALYIVTERRRRNLSAEAEDCLALHWERNRYVEAERKYDSQRDRLFTFARAMFRES